MARRSRSGRGSNTRKPITLDLQAETQDENAGETAPKAEPVAMEAANTQTTEDASTPDQSPQADDASAATETNEPDMADTPDQSDDITPSQMTPATTTIVKNRGFSAIGGGLIGGIVALLGAAGLQWGGILPSLAPAPAIEAPAAPDLSAIENEIATLRSELEAVQNAPSTTAEIPNTLTASLAETQSGVDTALDGLSTVQGTVEQLSAEMSSLSAAMSSGEAGEAPALEALSSRIDTLENTTSDLPAQIQSLIDQQTGGAETLTPEALATAVEPLMAPATDQIASLQTSMGTITQTVESLVGDVSGLQATQETTSAELTALLDRVTANEEGLANAGSDTTIARALAAAGLRTAIDRGLPFGAELEAFASVGGDPVAVEDLRGFAAEGVPTVAQLGDRVSAVANAIAATGTGLSENAGIGERLMQSARSLVQVRPVGQVEGDTPDAIAARIENAAKSGDLGTALAEWETLPDAAKAVSSEFVESARARQRVDLLIDGVLANAMASSAPATDQ